MGVTVLMGRGGNQAGSNGSAHGSQIAGNHKTKEGKEIYYACDLRRKKGEQANQEQRKFRFPRLRLGSFGKMRWMS